MQNVTRRQLIYYAVLANWAALLLLICHPRTWQFRETAAVAIAVPTATMLTALSALRRSVQPACGILSQTGCLQQLQNITTGSSASEPAAATETLAAARKAPLMKEFLIYRWNPEEPDKPRYESYNVDINRL